MSTEIKAWNPNDVVETVRERIRDQFVSLIPEDVFRKMVQTEIDNFMQKNDVGGYRNRFVSSFQQTVESVLVEATKTEVKKLIDDPVSGWAEYWNPKTGRREAGENIKQFLSEHSGEIVRQTIGVMFQDVISNIRR